MCLDGNPIDEEGLGYLSRALLRNGSVQSVSLNRCIGLTYRLTLYGLAIDGLEGGSGGVLPVVETKSRLYPFEVSTGVCTLYWR